MIRTYHYLLRSRHYNPQRCSVPGVTKMMKLNLDELARNVARVVEISKLCRILVLKDMKYYNGYDKYRMVSCECIRLANDKINFWDFVNTVDNLLFSLKLGYIYFFIF